MGNRMPLATLAAAAVLIAAPAITTASVPSPKLGTWKGKTSEGGALSFRLAKTTGSDKGIGRVSLLSLRFRVRIYCAGEKTYSWYNGVYPLKQAIRDGSAKIGISKEYQQKDAGGKKRKYYLNLQGTFTSSTKVNGTMYITSNDTGKICGTRNVENLGSPLTWKAARTGS